MTSDTLTQQVQNVLDEVRPAIQSDGGDIELIEIVDGIVTVRLKGACIGCPFSMYTLTIGIEQRLKEKIPGIKGIKAL